MKVLVIANGCAPFLQELPEFVLEAYDKLEELKRALSLCGGEPVILGDIRVAWCGLMSHERHVLNGEGEEKTNRRELARMVTNWGEPGFETTSEFTLENLLSMYKLVHEAYKAGVKDSENTCVDSGIGEIPDLHNKIADIADAIQREGIDIGRYG